MANSSGAGRETDSIRDWESKVGVELRRKEAQLSLAKKEHAELEKEVNQLIIANGEIEQSIKAELDATKQYQEQDQILTEKISDVEADLKLLRKCVEKQRECLDVCGIAQKVQEKEKLDLKSRIKGHADNYKDQLMAAKREHHELQIEYGKKLDMKENLEKVINAEYEDLNEKTHRVDKDIDTLAQENKIDEASLLALEQECSQLKINMDLKKQEITKAEEEFAELKSEEKSIDARIKDLNNQLQGKQDAVYASKQQQCKLHCQMKELLEKEDDLKIKKAHLQAEIDNIQKVVDELDSLKVHVDNVSLQVEVCQREAERLSGIEEDKRSTEIELSDLEQKSMLTSRNIEALTEEFIRLENIEGRKNSLDTLINDENTAIQAELDKKNELKMQLGSKEETLQILKQECENSCQKLSTEETTYNEKLALLQDTLRPRLKELKKLKEVLEVADLEVAAKEKEKNEMLMLVSRRTNEASMESKAKLDALKTTLAEKMDFFKETVTVVENLGKEVSAQEHYYKEELERVRTEEKKKIENAVEPVLRSYEERRVAEVEAQWQKELKELEKSQSNFLSPARSKKIQFSTKGRNLETSSPFDVILDSQDKTNRPPKLVAFNKQKP